VKMAQFTHHDGDVAVWRTLNHGVGHMSRQRTKGFHSGSPLFIRGGERGIRTPDRLLTLARGGWEAYLARDCGWGVYYFGVLREEGKCLIFMVGKFG